MVGTENVLPEQEVQVDTAGNQVNPSTIEKQNEILAKMPTLEQNGSVPVNIQDQTSTVVDFFFREILNTITLASSATANSNTINLVAGHSVVVGDTIVLNEGSAFFQAEVTNVATNTITLDSPIDFAFTTAAVGQRCNKNMAVNGSVTPRVFFITPASLTVDVDITHLNFHIEDNLAMDSTTFGGIAALTKGIVVRRKDGILKNYFNIKSNGDFGHHCDFPIFASKIGGGEYAVFVTKRFAGQENSGVAVRLSAATSDQLQIIIQDDLSALTEFHAIAHGHVVTN